MTREDEIRALLARVEAASGPDRMIDIAIYQALRPADIEALRAMHAAGDVSSYWFWMSDSPYTASIDAAVALFRKTLPKWELDLSILPSGRGYAQVRGPILCDEDMTQYAESETAEIPLAILAALLRALQADQTDAGGRDG